MFTLSQLIVIETSLKSATKEEPLVPHVNLLLLKLSFIEYRLCFKNCERHFMNSDAPNLPINPVQLSIMISILDTWRQIRSRNWYHVHIPSAHPGGHPQTVPTSTPKASLCLRTLSSYKSMSAHQKCSQEWPATESQELVDKNASFLSLGGTMLKRVLPYQKTLRGLSSKCPQ